MTTPRVKTYDRIVQESLTLFNQQGERNITTNHIAAHLGISPGNLYYHFRNKEEIIHQIFVQYRSFILERLTVPSAQKLELNDLTNYFDTAFQAMWRFRFMFYDLPGLLSRNPQLQADYNAFVVAMKDILAEHFRTFVALGLLNMQEADIEPTVLNIWLVVKFWFAFEQTTWPETPITEASSRRGVHQVLALLKPYIQPGFIPVFEQLSAAYAE